jgi:subtilase family serine protease
MKGSSRRSTLKLSRASQACIEPLEHRCLLSSTPSGFTPAQIAQAYGFRDGNGNALIKFGNISGDGTGQTIAIINAYDNPNLVSSNATNFSTSDLFKFDTQFGLPNNSTFFRKVNQTGGTTYPMQSPAGTGDTSSFAGEADLDVEWAHAIAPGANILLVEASTSSLTDLIGNPELQVGGAVDFARHAAGVSVVSTSFGVPEFDDPSVNGSETSYDQYFTTPANHSNVTFLAATGDSSNSGLYPAFSPNVVAVGDTSLTLTGNAYGSEVGFSKSGGGTSSFEAKPSYQSGITGTKRMIPDVAFDGDPNTSVPVYDSFDPQGPWIKFGGTSFATPAWAGLLAITNQGLASQSKAPLDGVSQTLPKLYSLSSSDFHDITSGNNGHQAAAGYDLVTGRGTPIANKLVPDLAGIVVSSSGGSITGTVFNDTNGNGVKDSGDAGITGWTVYNDANNNAQLDSGELRTLTDANGNYTFSSLSAGNYKIRELLPATGWKQTSPANGFGWTIALSNNQNQTAKNFGAQSTAVVISTGGSIAGTIFNDANGNGSDDSGELGLSGWLVYNDSNNNGKFDSGELNTTTTNDSGAYTFSNLAAGNYKIRMMLVSGFKQTTPSNGFGYTISLTKNQLLTGKNFGAEASGVSPSPPPPPTGATITGTVFNDANNDKKLDNGEAGLVGWTVYLDLNNSGALTAADPRAITNGSGGYSFTDLKAGNYIVRAIRPAGWNQTTPANGLGQHISVATNQTVAGILFGELA